MVTDGFRKITSKVKSVSVHKSKVFSVMKLPQTGCERHLPAPGSLVPSNNTHTHMALLWNVTGSLTGLQPRFKVPKRQFSCHCKLGEAALFRLPAEGGVAELLLMTCQELLTVNKRSESSFTRKRVTIPVPGTEKEYLRPGSTPVTVSIHLRMPGPPTVGRA